MKRLGSSSKSSVETVGVTGEVVGAAEEVCGAEDVAASVMTLVASVEGADETGTVSAEDGRTTVGRIGSKVSVATERGRADRCWTDEASLATGGRGPAAPRSSQTAVLELELEKASQTPRSEEVVTSGTRPRVSAQIRQSEEEGQRGRTGSDV